MPCVHHPERSTAVNACSSSSPQVNLLSGMIELLIAFVISTGILFAT